MQRLIELNKVLEKEVRERSSHKNPQYYHVLKNWQWSNIVVSLLNNEMPRQQDVDALCGVKNSPSNPSSLTLDLTPYIYDGANVMDVLNKYRDTVPDIHDRLRQAIKDAGFIIKGFYIRTDENK